MQQNKKYEVSIIAPYTSLALASKHLWGDGGYGLTGAQV